MGVMRYRYCEHDLKYQIITSTNVNLVVLGPVHNDPGHLSCIAKDDLQTHMRHVGEIGAYREGDNEEVHHPSNGEICLAKMPENGYIRIKCLENNFDGQDILVYSIDYGFVCHVAAHTVRVS